MSVEVDVFVAPDELELGVGAGAGFGAPEVVLKVKTVFGCSTLRQVYVELAAKLTRCVADGASPKKRSSWSDTPGPRRSKFGPSTPTLSSKCSVYEPGAIAAPPP